MMLLPCDLEKAWGWACGSSARQVVRDGSLAPCFVDAVLCAAPAACTLLCLLLLAASDARAHGGRAYRRRSSRLERLRALELLAAAAALCHVARLALDWQAAEHRALPSLLRDRPHAVLASGLAALAWAGSGAWAARVAAHSRSRRLKARCHFGAGLLLLWLLQATAAGAAAAAAVVRWARGGHAQPPQAVLGVVAAGLGLLWLALACAQEAALAAFLREWRDEAERMPSLASLLGEEQRRGRAPGEGERPLREGGGLASRLAFSWVSPLMRRGRRRQLRAADLFQLAPDMEPAACHARVWAAWTAEREKQDARTAESGRLHQPSLLRALARVFGRSYALLGLLKLGSDALTFAGPVLLNRLVQHLAAQEQEQRYRGGHAAAAWPARRGFALAGLLGLCALLKAVLNCQYTYLQGRMACQVQSSLTCAAYTKALLCSSATMAGFSRGAVQTLMAVDAGRVVNLCSSLHELWSLPLQIAAALLLLYTQVRLAFLAGLALVLLLIPVNRWLAARIEAASAAMMAAKDARVKRAGELLRGIWQVKAAAWEPGFVARVAAARDAELQALAVRKYLDAMCVFFWAATPLLMGLLTFGAFVLSGHALTPAAVFTSLALFNTLIAPLNSLPWVLNGAVEAVVSLRRLRGFLAAEEAKAEWAYAHPAALPARHSRLTSFEFSPARAPSLEAPLLPARAPRFSLSSSESLAVDVPRRASAPSAAAFGSSEQLPRPPECAVVFDAASFAWRRPAGGGGEGCFEGLVLRDVDLAVPQGSFMAVTGDVGSGKSSLLMAALGELCLVRGGVSVCGSVAYVPQTPWLFNGSIRDNILMGRPHSPERYRRCLHACALEADCARLAAGDVARVGEGGCALSGGQRARVALARALYQEADVLLLDDVLAAVDARVAAWLLRHALTGPLAAGRTRLLCTHAPACLAAADSVARLRGGRLTTEALPPPGPELPQEADGPEQPPWEAAPLLEGRQAGLAGEQKPGEAAEAEARQEGAVRWQEYRCYAAAAGPALVALVLVSLLLMQATRNGSDLWLARWVSRTHSQQRLSAPRLPPGAPLYLSGLLALAAANALLTLVRAFAFAAGGLAAAERLHARLLAAVVAAPVGLFDAVPAGRVLNRLSSDTATADDSLPFIMNLLLANAAALAGALAVLAFGQPPLLLALLPLAWGYDRLQRYYRATSREVRRLGSVARSPVYAGFGEALEGGPSIRAAAQQAAFRRQSEAAVVRLQQAGVAGVGLACWLALRLQLAAALLVAAVALLAVLDCEGLLPHLTPGPHMGRAGLVGLALSYALPITGLLGGLLSAAAETEQEMVAVERVAEYSRLAPQADTLPPLVPPQLGPPPSAPAGGAWPARGHVLLRGVLLRYRPDAPWALAGLDLEALPGEAVGVVGRTGAGKSSLLGALLRLREAGGGGIWVDGRDVRTVPLRTLRRAIGVVPQAPFLFEGTIRQNLDPGGEASDRDMIRALKDVRLWEILCGISLSQAKEGESPRSRARQAPELGMPVQSPRRRGGAGRPSPRGGHSSPRDIGGRPPTGSPQGSWASPRSASLTGSLAHTAAESPRAGRSIPGSGRGAEGSLRQLSESAPLLRPPAVAARGGLAEAAAAPRPEAAQGPDAAEASTSASQASSSGRTGAEERLPGLRPVSTPRRGPSRLQPRPGGRGGGGGGGGATSFSRFLGLGGWADSLAAETPAVLLHAGFGMQLLSMPVGEAGAGLSLGQQQLLCLARVLLRRPAVVCLDECSASVDPQTAAMLQQVILDQLAGCTTIQVAHRLDSVMGADRVAVMEGGRVIETGRPQELLRDGASHFACMRRAQGGRQPG